MFGSAIISYSKKSHIMSVFTEPHLSLSDSRKNACTGLSFLLNVKECRAQMLNCSHLLSSVGVKAGCSTLVKFSLFSFPAWCQCCFLGKREHQARRKTCTVRTVTLKQLNCNTSSTVDPMYFYIDKTYSFYICLIDLQVGST